MPLFQNPFQDGGPDGTVIKGISTIGGAFTGLVIGGFLIHVINVVAGSANIIEVIFMVLGGCIGFLVGDYTLGDHSQQRADHILVAGSKTHVILEVISAIVALLTIIGLVVGIAFPGKITGALLPLALILWFILYRVIEQKNN